MIINININTEDFPILNNIKDEDINSLILKIFKTGYNIHFPSNINLENNIVFNKINDLEHNLNKLINISSNSSKKGSFTENILEDIFVTRYGDIKYEKKNFTPHSGDAWLHLPDNKIIILESKNYSTTVPKDEIIKLENDMKTNNIKWAILTSFTSQIQGMKELDYYVFTHNKEIYSIIMISNLSSDYHKLDLGLQIIRKLIFYSDNSIKYETIFKDININLIELDKIIKKNYLLRDNFVTMENDIHKSLNNYYTILRDYQYDIDNKIQQIINKIDNTIYDDTLKLLTEYKDKKIFSILSRILDTIKNKKWIIHQDKIKNKNFEIGTIKIQIKKIIVSINDIDFNFIIGNEKQVNKNLELIKNF